MRTRTAALPFHHTDGLLVYGAAGVLILTLSLIACGRDHREAAARPAARATSSAVILEVATAKSPGGFGVRPPRAPGGDEPRLVHALPDVQRAF